MQPPLPPTDDARADLIQKVGVICDRIVRGQHATDRWQVKVFRWIRGASIVLSALGGAGLFTVKATPNLSAETGWALIGSGVSLAVGIALQLSNEFGIERTALQAMTAAELFSQMEKALDNCLVNDDPSKSVTSMLNMTIDPWTKFHNVIQKSSPALDTETEAYKSRLVRLYSAGWKLKPAQKQRKPKS